MFKNRYSEATILALKKSRQSGLTIEELMKEFKMPKTTIWHHIHDVELSDDVALNLKSKRGGSRKRKILSQSKAKVLAKEALLGENRELVLVVSMLYWAEGHKNSFVFTNTDVEMLKIYLKFLKKVLEINSRDIYILLRISDPIRAENAIEYWSGELGLPFTSFSCNHDNIQNKTKTKFGICRVMVKKSSFHHKVIIELINFVKVEFETFKK